MKLLLENFSNEWSQGLIEKLLKYTCTVEPQKTEIKMVIKTEFHRQATTQCSSTGANIESSAMIERCT